MKRSAKLLLASVLVGACATGGARRDPEPPISRAEGTAYEAAGRLTLPEVPPEEQPGLHNVYRLSEHVVSGAEPEGEEAFRSLQKMGVKTVLSVDGKVPDHRTAERYGIRYVHVPIRYRGITHEETLAIAKTFYELDGPFYVHCFHGQHRGPAAAAIGRVILDGVPREQAIAEMRQWCGTSDKYEGLYGAIAFGDIPTEAEARTFEFDFPAEHRFAGFRQGMIDVSRSWDTIEALSKRDWKPMADHPDANARNEAEKMAGAFEQMNSLEETAARPEDFTSWMDDSVRDAKRLAELLARAERGDAAAAAEAMTVAAAVKASCSACHKAYRNEDR